MVTLLTSELIIVVIVDVDQYSWLHVRGIDVERDFKLVKKDEEAVEELELSDDTELDGR